ncbi:carboxypeptidase regulatory-like domain-containing protein [bacterium]|nr:carboxypeptidase regulatory-like domain-containing protein [bacterium]
MKTSKMTFRWLISSTLVALIGLSGCSQHKGPEVAEVTGTITLDGQPLTGVNIQFVPQAPGGSPSFGGTNEDGQYRLLFNSKTAGALLGTHRVEILARDIPRDENGDLLLSVMPVKIPRRYSQPGALTADVHSGRNTIRFDLLSKP